MNANAKIELSDIVRGKIDQWLLRYPADAKRSAVMQALTYVQDEHGGWLTYPLLDAVADYLGLSPIAVYEVATFYDMYQLAPVGQHVIRVCTNISCMLRGADDILAHFKEQLGIEVGQTTADGKFTLQEVECLAACSVAPMCQINKKYYECLTPEKINSLLQELE